MGVRTNSGEIPARLRKTWPWAPSLTRTDIAEAVRRSVATAGTEQAARESAEMAALRAYELQHQAKLWAACQKEHLKEIEACSGCVAAMLWSRFSGWWGVPRASGAPAA